MDGVFHPAAGLAGETALQRGLIRLVTIGHRFPRAFVKRICVDGDPSPREAVDERGFSDVFPPDDTVQEQGVLLGFTGLTGKGEASFFRQPREVLV